MTFPKIYAVGETVFDIIFRDFQPQAAKPGGSAFNSLISLGRLGIPCSFISEVGNDRIGKYILEFLRKNEVENDYVIMFEKGKSALSLAFLNEDSDAQYDFYKDYPNQRLKEKMPDFSAQDYFLFGSFYGLNPALRPQIRRLLKSAKKKDALIYYDPNFRSSHLNEIKQLKGIIEENFSYATLVKASDEDIKNIYGIDNAEEAWDRISRYCNYFVYTANSHGVNMFTREFHFHVEVDRIEPLSTIGAGDTFNAGILYGLYNRGVNINNIDSLSVEDWKEILNTAANFSKEVCLSYDNYIGERS